MTGDALALLARVPTESVDLIFADPPYFLSTTDGTTVSGGERVSVDKGSWDRARAIQEIHAFNRTWLHKCRRVLKPSGTIWVSGTHHNIFSVGQAMQELGMPILNLVSWFKPNAAPNIGCRSLVHSTEQIVWAAPREYTPTRHFFRYGELKAENAGKQLRDMWEIGTTRPQEKRLGGHPTQKPLALLRRIMAATAPEGGLVLDPFCGSGTTGVAAIQARCAFLGFDLSAEYADLAHRRCSAAFAEGGLVDGDDFEKLG